MQLLSARIRNYKGYRDSGVIQFRNGFNILVGQNNSGKTAFLEALQFRDFHSKPHKNIDAERDRPLNPVSSCEIECEISGSELKNILLSAGNFYFLTDGPITSETALIKFNELLGIQKTTIRLCCENANWRILETPSHGLQPIHTANPMSVQFGVSEDRQSFIVQSVSAAPNDNIGVIVGQRITEQGGVYVFRAERLNLGQSPITDDPVLAANATNLASVLLHLMSNPSRYERLMEYIRLIFPAIYTIRARPRANQAEIQIWQVDPITERDDLAITLNDSGTGVGQVLAILYVVVTSNVGRTIVIDEPNSFLHPGASRKLLQI